MTREDAQSIGSIRVQYHANAQAAGGVFRPDLNDCEFCGANALVYVFDRPPRSPRFQCFGCGQNGVALDVAGFDCDGRTVPASLRHVQDPGSDWQARAGVAEARVAALLAERDRLLVAHSCPLIDHATTRLETLSQNLGEQTLPIDAEQKQRIVVELYAIGRDLRGLKQIHGALRSERDRLLAGRVP